MPDFNIHNLIRIRIDGAGDACISIYNYLLPFADSAVAEPDVVISVGPCSEYLTDDAEPLAINYRHLDDPSMFASLQTDRATLVIPDSQISAAVLRHHVRLLMHRALLCRGAALLKGCSLDYQGRGVLVCGPSGSGKTAAALLPLMDDRFRFLADDISLINDTGEQLTFPKPVWLHLYHVAQLTKEARKGVPARFSRAQWVQRLVRPSLLYQPARVAARMLRLWRPTRKMTEWLCKGVGHVNVTDLFPASRRTNSTKVSVVIFLRPQPQNTIRSISLEDALSRLFAIMHYHPATKLLGEYAYAGIFDLKGFLDTTEQIWRKFLSQANEIYELSVADRSPRALQAAVTRILASSRRTRDPNTNPTATHQVVCQLDPRSVRGGKETISQP